MATVRRDFLRRWQSCFAVIAIFLFCLPPTSPAIPLISPIVEIRHKRDNNPAARLVSTEAFLRFTEARIHGLDMGKKWIDEQTPKPKSAVATGENEKEVQSRNPKVVFGFKF